MNHSKKSSIRNFLFFGIVGAVGTVINTGLLYFFTFSLGLFYLLSSALATEIAIVSNFFGNHFFTFKDRKDKIGVGKKFFKFQMISLTTVIGTVLLLWIFTTLFGQGRLLIWNLAAIVIMFVANFTLNSKYTWKNRKITIVLFFSIFLVNFASAELVSTNQMGYHSENVKQVIVYTSLPTGTFTITNSANQPVYTGTFSKAKNYFNNNVECQGNNPCLVGYFTNLTAEGDYTITTSFSGSSTTFKIDNEIYENEIGTFFEFFDAQKQQDSTYHEDMHSGYNPEFSVIADGSFIMESNQASKTLMRLGSAYNRNPSLFDHNYRESIRDYVEYLSGLQGIVIESMDPSHSNYEDGFRLVPDIKINNVFVPGPTNLTSMNIYIPGSSHTISDPNVPVVSLCGPNNNSSTWNQCIEDAADYYKCQIDEPCINASYIEETGRVTAHSGYGVSTGWSTEFGCYFDVELDEELFTNGEMNPCLIFYPEDTRANTVQALLGFLEALPALYDFDHSYANQIFQIAYQTEPFIRNNYPSFSSGDSDAGYYGASLFLLYDYTGNITFLQNAHAMRSLVTPSISSVFVTDGVRGSEFYWEEYARHRTQLMSASLQYPYLGKTPEQMLQDKLFYDWKDAGPTSISFNGERVFQFDPNIGFQNSRYILTEGLFATKTLDLHSNPQGFTKDIADNQISWMTGMNAVQIGAGQSAQVRQYSFIFGIAPAINPTQFHSRYLINSGLKDETNGGLIGIRGSGKQFFNGTDYIYLDGFYDILGNKLGSRGNEYNGEEERELWQVNQTFNNNRDYIPGWVNGVFDVQDNEPDVIFNYRDSVDTYEFTETTNEIVATGIEYFSYLDAYYNNKTEHSPLYFTLSGNNNNTGNNNTNNTNQGNNTHTNSSSSSIIGNWSNVLPTWSEDRRAIFNVTLNSSGLVTWTLNGNHLNTTTGTRHSIQWTPDIFYTSGRDTALIMATSGGSSMSWAFNVNNRINPFFDPSSGTSGGMIHVFTNNNVQQFTNITVGVQSTEGSSTVTRIYSLSPTTAGNNETDWKRLITNEEFNFENNYLVFINASTATQSFLYAVPTSGNNMRAFYKPLPGGGSGGGSSGGSSGGGGGGSGGSGSGETLALVYAILEKNIIIEGEEQTITLDARSSRNLRRVNSYFLKEDGSFLILPLGLTSGNNGYGTWKDSFTVDSPGLYTLSFIELMGQTKSQNFSVSGRSFYAVSDTVGEGEKLRIIYTALDASTVDSVSDVALTLDARDFDGVKEISASINKKRGESVVDYSIALELSSGDEKYGTWKGLITVDQPDTTYTVKSITLSDGVSTKVYEITDRSIYATNDLPEVAGSRSLLTGSAISDLFSKPLDRPLFPFIFAIFIVAIVAGVIITHSKIKSRKSKEMER